MNVQVEWNCANKERKSRWAEDAGLLRPSAFSRDLPHWEALPNGWREKIAPLMRLTDHPAEVQK